MNKLLQTTLITVILATSCFAETETGGTTETPLVFKGDISGPLDVFGTFHNTLNTNVSALLHVGSGGEYDATNTTFLEGGGLIIDNKGENGTEQETTGEFRNNGTMDLTAATGESFSGPIIGGTVKLSDQTTGVFTDLELGKTNKTTVIYTASGTETLSIKLDEEKIIVKDRATTGSVDVTEDTVKAKFKIPEENEVEINLDNVTCETTDNRPIDLEQLIMNEEFNAKGVKLDTNKITEITQNGANDFMFHTAGNANIKLSLIGNGPIMFPGAPHIELTFSGDNSEYTGMVQELMVRKVVADGDNALPVNVMGADHMERLEIKSGANKIGSGSRIELMGAGSDGGFIIASGASFTISSGAMFEIM